MATFVVSRSRFSRIVKWFAVSEVRLGLFDGFYFGYTVNVISELLQRRFLIILEVNCENNTFCTRNRLIPSIKKWSSQHW